jgi:hypothetical protein
VSVFHDKSPGGLPWSGLPSIKDFLRGDDRKGIGIGLRRPSDSP